MSRRIIFPILVVILLLVACGAEPSPPMAESSPTLPKSEPEAIEEPAEVEQPAESQAEMPATDCLNGEVSTIGQSIADDYESTSYEQVITWFCNGAEYEDILVALETKSLTGTSVEEMLQMLADGLTWDDIWLLVGLTN